ETGAVSVFRKPSNNTNGNTRDRQGRLVSCEHDARRVTRTEHDGTITVLADRYQGKLLNSPNEVICKSDGSRGRRAPWCRTRPRAGKRHHPPQRPSSASWMGPSGSAIRRSGSSATTRA